MEALLTTVLWFSLGLIAYQFAGYPLLVAGLARFFDRHREPAVDCPSVSLIIAAYNEEAVIADKLANCAELDYPELEVIVVTDGSDDATPEIAAQVDPDRIRVLHDPVRRGKAAAINRGAGIATGDLLVFSDANALYSSDAISALAACFTGPEVAIVSGNKTVTPRESDTGDGSFAKSEGLYWRYEHWIRQSEDALGVTVGTVGEIFAVRRDVFRPLPDGVVNDDAFQTLDVLRRGFDVRYAPTALSTEPASIDSLDEQTRRRRISAGRWRLFSNLSLWPWRRPWVLIALFSHKWLRLLTTFLFLTALIANVLALLWAPGDLLLWSVMLLQTAFYVASYLSHVSGSAWRPLRVTTRLCHFMVESNVSTLLGFHDWLSGRENVLWTKVKR